MTGPPLSSQIAFTVGPVPVVVTWPFMLWWPRS